MFRRTETHTNYFNIIKDKITKNTENCHYNPNLYVRVECDVSRSGFGDALDQTTPDSWKPIAFASRFLNPREERYSVNELELLGVLWSIDYFKYYLYGKNFTVATDYKTLLSKLKKHRYNKSYKSLFSRWIYCQPLYCQRTHARSKNGSLRLHLPNFFLQKQREFHYTVNILS